MKRSIIGILAHVDAGKTTLSEAMLYSSGTRDKLGRVDKKDSFLDTHTIERERGITVFSKQAQLQLENTEITLIDTPGHVDFSCETERTVAVQDYAILVVSAPEGITAHTMTLFGILSRNKIPTFIFVNKTDIAGRARRELMSELKLSLGSVVTDFNLEAEDKARFFEECASADENLMSDFFDSGEIPKEKIRTSIRKRRIIPVLFGSALKCEGVKALLTAIDTYTLPRQYSESFLGIKVYKIGTDASGARLTYLKLTGGKLAIKDTVNYIGKNGALVSEKIESIRLYSADKFKSLKTAEAGMVVAVTGLTETRAGMGIGSEMSSEMTLEPALEYRMTFTDKGIDTHKAFLEILPLADEDPALSLRFDSETREIKLKLMGDIQTEVLTRVIKDRFGYSVSFGEGSILYKETIASKCWGAGHFEPLMHYAEVRLRLEPLALGTGLVFTSDCPTDRLRANWQRLILSHLEERAHKGILTGSPITDMKITLIAGRAHPKHTEGGDFREATFRALRQGLMKSEPILLEPIFDFEIELPQELLGRAMTDISNMHGVCDSPEFFGDTAKLTGSCPVYTMRSYSKELRAYSHGKGKITLSLSGYEPCHNAEEIISNIGYVPELDSSVSADSIFCKGGVGHSVPWYEADEKMHTENHEDDSRSSESEDAEYSVPERAKAQRYTGSVEEDKELMRIFESTYGKIKRRSVPKKRENAAPKEARERRKKPTARGEDYVIVDGYNLIFAWERLNNLAKRELSHARDTLVSILSNFAGFTKANIILVFDAYKRAENRGSVEEIGGITVVYTKERQTADAYIEKTTYALGEKNSVRVVTSDYDEQLVVLGAGGIRVTPKEFIKEVEKATLLED